MTGSAVLFEVGQGLQLLRDQTELSASALSASRLGRLRALMAQRNLTGFHDLFWAVRLLFDVGPWV